jgi:hypothetical protein
MSAQGSLFFWNNQNLFSNNYLEHRLPTTAIWKEQLKNVDNVFETIKKAYETTVKLKLGPGEEAGLEDKFIRPVLKALGYDYDVQPTTKRGRKKKRADYALFENKIALEDARKEKLHLSRFFSNAVTILEAKYWGRRLNDTDPKDTLDHRDPTAQTVKYLDDVYHASSSKVQWAILTNGKKWRLFYYHAASRSGNFFEVDLEEIMLRKNIEEFLYFYLFFSKDAFVADPITDKTWLDQHLKGSEDYATRVSDKLKQLIFDEIFEGLAAGFIKYRRNELKIKAEDSESLREVFNGCLALLYRLLFLLYAESRDLLPISENGYLNVSFKKIKEDIFDDIKKLGTDKISKKSYSYWARIDGLSHIIAEGDSAINVPIYNGGLFETLPDSFLSKHKVADCFFAEAIELLTVDHEGDYPPEIKPFIDYSSLNVRHLGDIYEGLLEFHIQIADEETVEVKEKGKSIWKKKSEIKKSAKTYRRKLKDEVYIENIKHDRRATGSYYTPHYVVEYIVSNAVDPIIEERLKIADNLLKDLEGLYDKQRRQLKKPKEWKHWEHPGEPKGRHIEEIIEKEKEVFETLFDIKVLDPAMGSGHFIVHAVDFITDKIVSFLADFPENPVIRKIEELRHEIIEEIKRQGVRIDEAKLTEVNLIKRMVMKRSIYGVDLNAMAVELAKLSLWLDSFTLGAPLSFLDHHLKSGNSLIGIYDISNVIIPGTETYGKVQRALQFMIQVSELTDATISETKKSYDLFKHVQEEIAPICRRFHIATAQHFIDIGKNIGRIEQLAYTLKFDKEYPENVEICKRALQLAEEKLFFHWKLEFPEVFFTTKGEKENPGFDCVIGNPPYINVAEVPSDDRDFLMKKVFYSTTIKRMDIFVPFHELSIKLLKIRGRHSFIVPFPLLTQDYGQQLRLFFLKNTKIESIVDLSKFKIFPDVAVRNIIPLFEKRPINENYGIIIISQEEDPNNIQRVTGKTIKIDASQFTDTYKNMFRIDLTPPFHAVQKTMDSKSIKFGKIFAASWGARGVPAEKYHLDKPVNKYCKKMVKGSDINRYDLIYAGKWFLYDVKKLYRPSMPDFFKNPKIMFQEVTGKHGLIGVFDDERYYTDHSLICCIPKYCFEGYDEKKLHKHKIYITGDEINISKLYNPLYILAIMNSQVNGFYFSKFIGYDLNVYPENIEFLSIPEIVFKTKHNDRELKVKKAVEYYDNDENDVLVKLTEQEMKNERNDTIHDILAYLAEKMIEMNKKKSEEISGFLKWLEREIKANIDELSNKTYFRDYDLHGFEDFLEILKKNKKNILIDPSARKTQEYLEKNFIKSLTVLKPIKEKINQTDNLIDEIVFKLYGLTQEEINMVKGA